ncbi:J domain-containing protein [Salmonella enterica subsp. salamae]|uniref:J domain-containing protein n=1 Tax=Salmonella enterica TaxID=28901 RepID=A0A5V3YHN9_SALER|nr:J domain-containing protein [Salmonella enterica]ECH9563392.1 J domain-containing protein [Salmonella enterica subsp. salamae]ECI4612578.1 J domain-containing protein [Salmonella enterica subsp. diarizonae]EDX3148511.1 hypothetical protein [Salmonella enterica subsp. diarizonae serovar 61:l,v:1,5,7]EBI0310396.1 hypothetical protein [Salmonella enterica]
MTQSGSQIIVGAGVSGKQENSFWERWKKVAQYERRNEKATVKVNTLYQEYEQQVMPHDRKMGETRCRWLRHLMSFLDSKELKRKDRQLLFEYVDEQLSQMQDFPFFYDPQMLRSLTEYLDHHGETLFRKERKQVLDQICHEFSLMMKATFGEDVDIPHSQLREVLNSGNREAMELLFKQLREEYVASQTGREDAPGDKEPEWQDFEFNYSPDENDSTSTIREIFRGSQLSKIYRQIARVVHPDREQDPLKKEEKHRLMQQLVKARKEGDVVTLVTMYGEFVPDGDILLDSEALEHVDHLLSMRLWELNHVHRDIFHGQGFKTCVWKQFSASSKKQTREKMTRYIRDVHNGIKQVEKDIQHFNTPRKVVTFIHSVYW